MRGSKESPGRARAIAIEPESFPWFDYSRYTFSLGLDLGQEALLSGHTASTFDPEERRIVVRGGMGEQVRTAYAKIEAILAAAGYGLDEIVRVAEYVSAVGIELYAEAESVRRDVLGDPVVTTVCVNNLLRPDALIEIEVVARRGGAPVAGAGSMVYLPTCHPLDERGEIVAPGDLGQQLTFIYERIDRALVQLGLGLEHVGKLVEYLAPEAAGSYSAEAREARFCFDGHRPAGTAVTMRRLQHPGSLAAVAAVASRQEPQPVETAHGLFQRAGLSAAVRAGSVVFLSGQAGVDLQTGEVTHPGDVVEQAEGAYANLTEILNGSGLDRGDLVETIEYIGRDGLEGYRGTAAVRARSLQPPYPASTGIVCESFPLPDVLLTIDPLAVQL